MNATAIVDTILEGKLPDIATDPKGWLGHPRVRFHHPLWDLPSKLIRQTARELGMRVTSLFQNKYGEWNGNAVLEGPATPGDAAALEHYLNEAAAKALGPNVVVPSVWVWGPDDKYHTPRIGRPILQFMIRRTGQQPY